MMYGPVAPRYLGDGLAWSFDAIGAGRGNDSDDGSSNAPALGSDNGEYLQERMMEDFGDEESTPYAGTSTPMHFEPPSGTDDEDVKEIRIEAD
jgi:ubiquitin carboxyl-terminal hydrolase 4/11/15